jgi:hypothetical protein
VIIDGASCTNVASTVMVEKLGLPMVKHPSGPITRLSAKRFKEALNRLIQENGPDSKMTKMGSNNDQGLVHVIKAIDKVNYHGFPAWFVH